MHTNNLIKWFSYSPVRPAGHFPDELMTEGPVDLSWDDVRVRYQYYKDRGYLRGLGLQVIIKIISIFIIIICDYLKF